METAIDYLLNSLPERYRNAMFNTCQEEIKQAKEKEKEYMVGFHRWMLRTDTADNAEGYFHYTDEDMATEYFNDFGPGWRDLTQDLEAVPSLSDEEIMEMFQKEYESPGWVDPMIEMLEAEEAPAESWMDEYYDDYIKLQASGMMFEFHPTWAGIWDKDKYAFCHDRKYNK